MTTRKPVTQQVEPSFAELYTPKFITVFREGYGLRALQADAIAGLTVAVVALPLSMGIAIASGVSPDRGLYTAIIGGFLISLLSGSRFQIGGPAGAFIALVAMIVERHGYDGLVLATLMAGVIMLAVAALRVGNTIRLIPAPVIVGFTCGVAVIIAASQVKDFLGLTLPNEPADFLPKVQAIWAALPSANVATIVVAVLTCAIVIAVRRFRPAWPAFLIAIAFSALAVLLLKVNVDTIGSRFGGIPHGLPAPELPAWDWVKIQAVFPSALAIALLGSIELLLSAVVADSMTGRKHRSNAELVAQGFANIGSVLFGGICVTGTIARTATNIRSGAHGPVAGILHSVYLLVFMMLAASLVSYIPLAALAAMLVIVAWNMVERHEASELLRGMGSGALILLATFLFTVFVNLIVGIGVGTGLSVLFYAVGRMRKPRS